MQPKPVLPPTGLLTLEQAIKTAAQAFEKAGLNYGHGTDNAVDEATWLLLHAMGLPVDEAPDFGQELCESVRLQCNTLLQRRIQERIPVAYLTGTAWFAGYEFFCDERALVPRSPLAEFIMDDYFGLFQDEGSVISKPPVSILDLCTGGGCIGIACALYNPDARVTCSDISEDALQLARSNIAQHKLDDRVNAVQSDLLSRVQGPFDLIVSNPPYVDAADIDSMPEEFHAEPLLGLAAGPDGLDLVHTLLKQASKHLTPRGWLVVEVGNSQPAMQAAYPNLPLSWLDFSLGGHGVFAISQSDLLKAKL
jgi:ribosomal protein L3 glutamine methyltransferase